MRSDIARYRKIGFGMCTYLVVIPTILERHVLIPAQKFTGYPLTPSSIATARQFRNSLYTIHFTASRYNSCRGYPHKSHHDRSKHPQPTPFPVTLPLSSLITLSMPSLPLLRGRPVRVLEHARDLTNQVERKDRYCFACGGHADVYMGEYLGLAVSVNFSVLV